MKEKTRIAKRLMDISNNMSIDFINMEESEFVKWMELVKKNKN
jgi:hypothetical protein